MGPTAGVAVTAVLVVWGAVADAARVRVHDLRNDLGWVLRLLGAGLPLTVLAGWVSRPGCSLG